MLYRSIHNSPTAILRNINYDRVYMISDNILKQLNNKIIV